MKRSIFYLHIKELDKAPRKIRFENHNLRTKYLALEKNKARFKKLEFSYRRGEYLRIYKGPITFIEYDIKGNKKELVNQYWRDIT
jgi:hypothetical protein